MLDNPLLTTVGSLIGVSGSILSYIMVLAYSYFSTIRADMRFAMLYDSSAFQ